MKCAYCGGPRVALRNAPKESTGTRLPHHIWVAALAGDEFCSRECFELSKGIAQIEQRECLHCGATFPVSQMTQKFCSLSCKDKARRKRSYTSNGVCSGCGVPHDGKTMGCDQCWERHRNRERRKDPGYLASERIRDRKRKNKARPRRASSQSVARPCPVEPSGEAPGRGGGQATTLTERAA